MPKTLAKPHPKKKAVKKAQLDTAARMRKATRPSHSHKPIAQRMREATGARRKPQRSRTMDGTQEQKMQDQKQQQHQPRGAGSGEKATATRSRSLIDWPPEPIPHKQAVDALEKEAKAQADFNDQMNELQTKAAKRVQEAVGHPQGEPADADEQRRQAMEAYENETDPAKKEAAIKGAMDARAKRDKAAQEKR